MASPATANFLAAWRSHTRQGALLVKVEISDPSAETLYLSSLDLATPDGVYWEQFITEAENIEAPGDFNGNTVQLCSTSFTMARRKLASQAVNDDLMDHIAAFRWIGATVTYYLWETSLSDFADAFQVFKGVIQNYDVEENAVLFSCLQRRNYNFSMTPIIVSKDRFPRAPETSLGSVLPTCYGALRDVPARPPASNYGDFQQGIVSVAGGRRAFKGVVTKVGRGNATEKGQVLFAGHACKTFHDQTKGCTPYILIGDRLAQVDPNSGTIVNGASGTGFDIDDITTTDDDPFNTFFPIPASNIVLVGANNVESPRSALDPYNDTSYARLDWDAGFKEVRFNFPSVPSPGSLREAFLVFGYTSVGSMANVRLRVEEGVASSNYTPTGSATPRGESCFIAPYAGGPPGWGAFPLPNAPYDFGDQGKIWRLYFTAAAAGVSLNLFYIGIVCRIRPDWPVIHAARFTFPPEPHQKGIKSRHRLNYPVPAITRVDSTFFVTLDGYEDNGGGDYTGVASALIERPCDIITHALVTYGAQSLSNVERGSSTFGSLVLARDLLKTWRGSDMVNAIAVTQPMDVISFIEEIAGDAFCQPYISRFTDKWHLVPWRRASASDYDFIFGLDHITEPTPALFMQPDTAAITALRIPYGYDEQTGTYLHECRLSPSDSSSGFFYRNIRDGNTVVIASKNDRINFHDGADHTCTLTAAAYVSLGALALEAQTQMRSVAGGGITIAVAPCFEIVASFNTKLDFKYGGTTYAATIDVGHYYDDPNALCANIAAKMNALAPAAAFAVTYNATTNKFKFTVTGTPAGVTDGLLFGTGTNKLTSIGPTLGFTYADASITVPASSVFEVEPENVYFVIAGGTLKLKWETGADGLNAGTPRYAASLFGHDPVRDISGTTIPPHSPVRARELAQKALETAYGPKTEQETVLRSVVDTDTAREIRNRRASLTGTPRAEIRFITEHAPDLERGRVIQFSHDFTSVSHYPVFGSDGLWSSKIFRVTEVTQHLVSSWHQEVVAVEIA